MDIVTPLLVGAAAAGVLYLLKTAWERRAARCRYRPPPRLSEADRRRHQHVQQLNAKARALQVALFRLTQAPDFRRVASWAAQTQDVPLAFRQRQFRRFRPRLVQHFAARMAAGTDLQVMLESLQSLLRSLGIATFEAEYIRTDAERQLPRTAPSPTSFSSNLLQLQREHQQRLEALRSLAGLDNDTREQLLEAEITRFRDSLENLGQQDPPPATGPAFGV